MAFGGYEVVNPSLTLPQLALQISQRTGAFEVLPEGKQLAMLGATDQYVYLRKLEMRGVVNTGQSAANQLDGPSFVTSLSSTPTYLMRTRAEYDHHDTANAGNWGVSLPEAYRVAAWQIFAQAERNALLYGVTASNGEGLLNTSGATAVTMPADSNGHTTFLTYDNGELATFFLQQIVNLRTRMYLGLAPKTRIVIVGPQRILTAMHISRIVQLTQYQRPGAGAASAGLTVDLQMEGVTGDVIWACDDTLEGKGAGGKDAVLIVAPEIEKQSPYSGPDTNKFYDLSPSLDACVMQLTDMPSPREIVSPLAGGATDVVYEKRVTSGWGIRPEAITILSIAYE